LVGRSPTSVKVPKNAGKDLLKGAGFSSIFEGSLSYPLFFLSE